MIGDVKETHAGLRDRQQSAFHRRDRHPRHSVGMRNAIDVMARHVDRAVNDEARRVHAVVGCVEQDVAVDIDLDEARCVDLLIEQTIGIDEKLVVRARHAA